MPVYVTEATLDQLKKDLHHARTAERKQVAKDIAEARAHGDLSENAEYDAAKEAQGKLEARIAQMESTLANARILDERKVDTSKAYIRSTVRVLNSRSGKEQSFVLVSAPEADLSRGRISVSSPIGKGLLGKSVGEVAVIQVPAGEVRLEVLEILRDGT